MDCDAGRDPEVIEEEEEEGTEEEEEDNDDEEDNEEVELLDSIVDTLVGVTGGSNLILLIKRMFSPRVRYLHPPYPVLFLLYPFP